MSAYEKLKRNSDFTRVYRRGRHKGGRWLVLHAFERRGNEKKDISRVGFTISRKEKSSVKRNRMKRILREVFRLSNQKLRPGFDIVIAARWQDEEPGRQLLEKELIYLLNKLDLVEVD